jgi:hypothetical protein
MFPDHSPTINRLKRHNIPALSNAVNAIIALGLRRRNFKMVTPTPFSTVVLSVMEPDNRNRLYVAQKGEAKSSIGNYIDISEYDDKGNSRSAMLEMKKRAIKDKEANFQYDCSTVAGASDFLTDLAYYPALTGCHYESYGNQRFL